MARRAFQLKKTRSEYPSVPLLHLDAGGFIRNEIKGMDVKLETILKTYQIMAVDAVNVSEKELVVLGEGISQLQAKTTIPFVSANILDNKTGKPIFNSYVIINKGDYKIGVTGVAQVRKLRTLPGSKVVFEMIDPVEAVKPVLKELKGKVDVVVLMAHLQFRTLKFLAEDEDMQDIDLIVGGDGYTTTWSDVMIGEKVVSYGGRQGMKFMLLKSRLKNKGIAETSQEIVQLKVNFPEDEEIKELVDLANGKISRSVEKVDFVKKALMSQVNNNFVSYSSCRSCHKPQYEKWRSTRHYMAANPLIKDQKLNDHSCLPCHTTGYRERGFVDIRVTPTMIHVQCEACHGEGGPHAKNPTTVKPGELAPKTTCVICHDKSNSPNFDYQTYWAKIKH